jgi:hypothetical protein
MTLTLKTKSPSETEGLVRNDGEQARLSRPSVGREGLMMMQRAELISV